MRIDSIKPVFIQAIDKEKEEGILYISKEYKCAIHLCACGCKRETVTPLKASEWTLTEHEDGAVSLSPSIGNFKGENPYHAHYFITNNKIIWS